MATTRTNTSNWSHTFAADVPELVRSWKADVPAEPSLAAVNPELATQLGLDIDELASTDGLREFLTGDGQAVAMAYAGHQFGGYSPLLGDGRALLLGEATDQRLDLHLKGSGPTPFARGGDGKAALGPMLREYVVAESMHALGIPTTRALAVIATGERVFRETGAKPGAILVRVAPSHLRVGTFEFAARLGRPDVLKRLADHVIARHYPDAASAENSYVALLKSVVSAQARLIAGWMSVGFIHGVMNTDNMAISGHAIDYGPCAFLDEYDPAAVFSSIDHQGRYAFGNQPSVALWNLARFAESLLGLIDDEPQQAIAQATEILDGYPALYQAARTELMGSKLGFDSTPCGEAVGDIEAVRIDLLDEMLTLMHEHRADYTGTFVDLADWLRELPRPATDLWEDPRWQAWLERWREHLTDSGRSEVSAVAHMQRVNPTYIPRNHLLEQALEHAERGDPQPVHELISAVTDPYGAADHPAYLAEAPPAGFSAAHQTYCGT